MKCPHCDEDLFPKQFKCHKCGKIVADKEEKKKVTKEKKDE